MNRIRVLHCPTPTGGNPGVLARAEREVGLDSWAVSLRAPPFGHEVDEVLWRSDTGPFARELERLRLLGRALRRFDVVHFNAGSTLTANRIPLWFERDRRPLLLRASVSLYTHALEQRDLPVLRLAGKGIAVTFQGSDARQSDFSLENFDLSIASESGPGRDMREWDSAKRRRIEVFDRYADRIYALNPDLLRVLPKRATFLPYASVDLRTIKPVRRGERGLPLVVHAPSRRETKGTKDVLAAVERLRSAGIEFDFRLIEGLSREQAIETFREADLVIDQLISGWYGSVAVEAMALGRPVIAYVREEDLEFIPAEMRDELPVVDATPATLQEVLRAFLTGRRGELATIGERGRRYVERWHDPVTISERLKRDYERIVSGASGRE